MLASPDLPDLDNLRHIVDDCSDDLGDILSALEHAVEQHSANLPATRQVKDVNWRAKLILAELRSWAKDKPKEDSIIEFKEMLANLKAKSDHREAFELQFMQRLYKELTGLNGKAQKTINQQLLQQEHLV